MIIIAHNIRSLHNVGSIFRNCAAFGVEKLFLTGFTEAPPRKEIAKVALGAESLVPWEKADVNEVIEKMHHLGYTVVALETGADAQPLTSLTSANCAIVLGNEADGIDPETLTLCDQKVEIPMAKKRSLNVSVASGVIMYHIQSL